MRTFLIGAVAVVALAAVGMGAAGAASRTSAVPSMIAFATPVGAKAPV